MLPFKDDNPTRTFPFVVLALLAANIGVFAWQKTIPVDAQQQFVYTYASIPAVITGAGRLSFETEFPPLFTLFTSMFLHGNLLHIGGNMLFLWVFGNNIEDLLGHLRFIAFYLVCGLLAMGAHVLVNPGSPAPTVGASGAISGVLGAYLLRYPGARVHTLILPLPIVIRLPAFFVLGYWFLIQWLRGHAALAMGPQMGGTAWFAHIGGFVVGMLLIALFRPRPKRPPPPPVYPYRHYHDGDDPSW